MKQYLCQSLLAGILMSSLVSCTSGPLYSDVQKKGLLVPKQGKGLALIYCPSRGGGINKITKVAVWVNGEKLSPPLGNMGFYTYEASPGAVSFSPKSKEVTASNIVSGGVAGLVAGPVGVASGVLGASVRSAFAPKQMVINMSANQVYYVKYYDAFWGPKLEQVSEAQAIKEKIQRCHWMNPAQKD